MIEQMTDRLQILVDRRDEILKQISSLRREIADAVKSERIACVKERFRLESVRQVSHTNYIIKSTRRIREQRSLPTTLWGRWVQTMPDGSERIWEAPARRDKQPWPDWVDRGFGGYIICSAERVTPLPSWLSASVIYREPDEMSFL